MKILYVYQFCTLGGVETVLRNRLSAFRKRGIFPYVVFLNDLGGSKIFEGLENIHYENRGSELKRLIDEGGFDFVIPIDTPQIYPILKKSHFKGILVTEVHTNNLNILRYLSDIGETKTKAIITPSQFEKELIYKEIGGFGKTGIPIYIVPNPINPEVFYFKEPKNKSDKKVIGWVGRLEKEKNWKHFLEIASSLSGRRNDVLFLVIGGYNAEGTTKKDFLSMVKRLNLIDSLKWIPYLPYDKMPGVYSLIGASGGCLVTTSIIEPFGMTAIEAMACQCPIVASRVGGFQEVIEDGKTGLLFEVNNTQEGLVKIETLIVDASERACLIKNGFSTVEKTYSSEKVVEKYLGILKELAEQIPKGLDNETEGTESLSYKIKEKPFNRAVYKFFEKGMNSPMYETYVNYALSTNDRGKALAHDLSRYLKLKNKSYLDIGTAYGGYLVAFAKQGCKPYMGIEIDQEFIELCKLNLIENNLDPDCVLQWDICDPFSDNFKEKKIDIVTCTDVLEHVLDVPKALESIKYLLADKGHLYLEIPNRYHVNNVLSDPHFGLFGITLLNRNDAIEYFKCVKSGDYSVADYYELDYYLSFFPEEYFRINKIFPQNIDFKALDHLFGLEVRMVYESKIDYLLISMEMKNKLIEKFKEFVARYIAQIQRRNFEYFYVQNWKILIQKR
jgi:glycosyltransferase involved in cell wall biosynthesis/SAM-dependent methyltransferase